MPTYEYRCSHCGHRFEEFQSMSAEPFELCPACGRSTLKRMFGGGAGMIFKGSGFYLTDYRKTGQSDGMKGKPSTSAPSTGGDTKKSGPSAPSKDKPAES